MPPLVLGDGAARLSEKIEDPGQHLAEMPMPLSRTLTMASPPSRDIDISMRPCGDVYFAALLRRLANTCVQAHRIALDDKPLIAQRDVRFVLASLQQGVAGLDRLMDDGGKVEMLFPELDLPARDARDLKQIVDEANEMIHLPSIIRQQKNAPGSLPFRVADVGFLQDRKQHCGWALADWRSSWASVARNSSLRRSLREAPPLPACVR